jgi:two-component system, cell cycle sensor histidine kinase and response regulator CckA
MSSAPESRRDSSLRAMLELVPVLYWETDASLRLTALEGMALRAMGVSAAEFLGRPVEDFLFPHGASPESRRAHEKALAGESAMFDLALNGRDLRASTRGWTTPNGPISGVAGMAVDLTDRIFAERALRLSEHGYRTLIEEAPYAIARCTAGGELLQVNRAMTEMLGYDPDAAPELLLLDFPVIFAPEGSFEIFRRKLVDGERGASTECAWARRDGSRIQVRVTGRLVGEPGRPGAYLDVFAEDVTEMKRLEAELTDAQRMQAIGQLAGGVAHDFNNLLTVIGGHVELLLGELTDPETRDRLDEVKGATEKAADLTRQLLAFGRRQVLRSRVVNLNKVIAKLMGMLRRVIKANVELRFEPGDALATVNADPNEIERVLLNLAINAQDAMPVGGTFTIETANIEIDETTAGRDLPRPGEYVQILVRDTGIGMDGETQARAFEPFFTTKHASEGSGLGLAVVYGVVRQSGGHISLASEPGAGTAFRIYLPRVGAVAVTSTEAPPALAALPGGNETILFAEDDRAIRSLISRVLEKLGYRVLAAEDGAAGIEIAHAHSGDIHLLLSDIIMPAVGGHELAARLKAEKPDLKVVFISGYAGHQLAATELEAGGVCFLQKPVPMDVLANTIRGVLDGYLP